MDTFSQLHKNFRLRAKLTQDEVAAKLGVKTAYVTMLETGRTKPPTPELCEQIAEALSLDELEKKLIFEKAALDRITSNRSDQPFFELLGTPVFGRPSKAASQEGIPLLDIPTEKILPPFENQTPLSYVTISEILYPVQYFAIRVPITQKELGLSKGDIAVVDPLFKALKTDDLVLVKLGKQVELKQLTVLSLDSQKKVYQFSGHSENSEGQCFDPGVRKKDWEILGRLAFLLKTFS